MMPSNLASHKETRPVAVVTGAARGIGRSIAVELSRHGYDIAAVDVAWEPESSTGSPRQLEWEVAASGARCLALAGDIADLDAHGGIIEAILHAMGRMDLLVNNAGVAPLERRDILEMDPGSYDRVLSINLRGTFFFTQQVVRWMLRAGTAEPGRWRNIVFITSISADVSSLNRGEYCISKAGLSMVAKLFSDRLAAAGIGVYEIRPGIIHTSMTAPVKEKYDRMIAEGLIPQGRWGYPEDIARAVVALAAGAFGYSTGAVIEISGGMNIRRL